MTDAIWNRWTNGQDPAEFLAHVGDAGTLEERCREYVNDCLDDRIFGSETPELSPDEIDNIAADLADYLEAVA